MATDAATLKEKLSQQLDAARAKLEALKLDVRDMHEEDMAAFQERQQDLQKRMEGQKEHARQLQSDIARWKSEKVAHTKDAIASWTQRREVDKLQARAERAKEYALDMVSVTVYDFEEAEQAIYEALAARFEAESAASSAT
jgi:predicted  nucleic acid-binding Zn-ribbon protein